MKNAYKICGEYTKVYIPHHNIVSVMLIDTEDIELVSQLNSVTYRGDGYARARNPSSKNKEVSIHRYVLGSPIGIVDHINRDRLDNRKCNLRVVTQGENIRNSTIRYDNPLGMKGVIRRYNRYQAWIQIDRKKVRLGTFATLVEAGRARVRAELQYYNSYEVQRTAIKNENIL